MDKKPSGDNKLLKHEKSKQQELIWALATQDYTPAAIARIFNFKHRSTVLRIVQQKPRDWQSPWVKRV